MTKSTTTLLTVLLLATLRGGAAADPGTTLRFDAPARAFRESLPLGNGRIGAMVFGGVDEERIVLNESSLWSGSRDNEADRPDEQRHQTKAYRIAQPTACRFFRFTFVPNPGVTHFQVSEISIDGVTPGDGMEGLFANLGLAHSGGDDCV